MTEGIHIIQLNLSTTATLAGQKKVAVVERLKQEWMYGLSAKKNGRCREVAVSVGGSTAVDVRKEVPYTKTKNHFVFPYSLMWGLNYVVFY